MKIRICPICGRHNPVESWHCVQCGESLSVDTITDMNDDLVKLEQDANTGPPNAPITFGLADVGSEKCKGVTKEGKPCRNRPLRGSEYCWQHQPFAQPGADFSRPPPLRSPVSYSSTQPSRNRSYGWWITIGIVIVAIVYSVGRYLADESNYTKGHQAYQKANCSEAIAYFDRVINAWRLVKNQYVDLAPPEREECLSFQEAVDKQQAGDLVGAFLAYDGFVLSNKLNPYSNKKSPLVGAARNHAREIFDQANLSVLSVLASKELCDDLNVIKENDLVPQPDKNLPDLYLACAHVYEDSRDFERAIRMYDSYLSDFPNLTSSADVQAELARSIAADAKAAEVGKLPLLENRGKTRDGTTVVLIQNSSPERLRIIFSGPEARIEELGECKECPTYSFIGPLECPRTGPVGRYPVQPGQYAVVVESISNKGTIPWSGDWNLRKGNEYFNCFVIVYR